MNWPYVLALIISGSSAIVVCIMVWRRRGAPAANALMILGSAIAAWTFTYAVYFMVPTPRAQFFWLRATYLGVLVVPTAFLLYAVQFSNKGGWLKKWVLAGLSLEPFVTFIILWVDPGGFFFGGKHPTGMIMNGGPWFWVNVVYSYGLILLAIVLLIDAYRHTVYPLRLQTGVIVLGAIFPWAIDILAVAGFNPLPNLDLTPFALSVTCLTFLIGLSRYGLLDIIPIARDALIESMDDGVVVLDAHNRVVDINQTALKMIGKEGHFIIGESAEDLFDNAEHIFYRFKDTLTTRQEILIGTANPQCFDLRISPIYDRKARFSGRLIVARDITERRLVERTEHEQRVLAEALRDTAVALNSSTTFNEVLDHLLDNVARVVPYDLATFLFIDQQGFGRAARSHGYREHGLDEKQLTFQVTHVPSFHKMIETGLALVIPDTQQSKDWAAIAGLEMVRSFLGVPLKQKGEIIGFLDLASLTPNFYTQAHADRLQSFADQAAIAIENSRLFDETRQRAEQMTALFDIGLTVTSGLDMDQVLRTLLKKCQQVLPIEAFYIAVLDPDTGLLHHPLAYDMGDFPQIPPRDINKDPGLSGYIVHTRQTLYIPDLLVPEAIKTFQIFRTSGTPTRSFVGVPMVIGEQVVGVISIQSYQPNAYDASQIRLLETIGTQAAVAIENSRLYIKAQQEIKQREKAEHRYRALFEQSHDAVFILDFEGKHLEVNQRAADLLGYTTEELMQLTSTEISGQKHESQSVMKRLMQGEHIPLYERTFIKKDGKRVVVEINVELVRDEEGTPIHVQSVARDITERKRSDLAKQRSTLKLRTQIAEIRSLQAQLRDQATRDSLTGLYNRRFLEETLEREFLQAKRKQSTVCLIMMDIDGFKGFNDTYGHDAGDVLLRKLGELLRSEVRASDISCRFGGEEFLVVLPGTSLESGYERAEHLRKTFLSLVVEHMGEILSATLSLGVAIYPRNGNTWEEVLHSADRAMYAAKDAGKNCTRTAE